LVFDNDETNALNDLKQKTERRFSAKTRGEYNKMLCSFFNMIGANYPK
jgi:hypothetical protein